MPVAGYWIGGHLAVLKRFLGSHPRDPPEVLGFHLQYYCKSTVGKYNICFQYLSILLALLLCPRTFVQVWATLKGYHSEPKYCRRI